MKLREFLDLHDWLKRTVVINDDNLQPIVKGIMWEIIQRDKKFRPETKVKGYTELFEMQVVSFGFYDNELCIRVK